ncbi:MAG: hypothetical protein AB9844_05935 [Clostridiaceae bacterium]
MLKKDKSREKEKYSAINFDKMDIMLVSMGILYKLYSAYYPGTFKIGYQFSFPEAAAVLYEENF